MLGKMVVADLGTSLAGEVLVEEGRAHLAMGVASRV